MKKVLFHIHTKYSYDVNTSYYSLIKKCIDSKVDIVAVCDHNEFEGGVRLSKLASFDVILGEEILTNCGEVIGLNLSNKISPNLDIKTTLTEIKKQGGLVYLPHPFDRKTRKTALQDRYIRKYIDKIDIIEVHNGRTIDPRDNEKALKFAIRNSKIMAVGDDAHTYFEISRNYQFVSDKKDLKLGLRNAVQTRKRPVYFTFLITKFVRFTKRRNLFGINNYDLIGSKCDLCGSGRVRVIYQTQGEARSEYYISDDSYGVHGQINRCYDCGLVFVYPRVSKSVNVKRYSQFVDNVYENQRIFRYESQKKLISRIEKIVNGRKLLDVGCATGVLVETAKNMGWETRGIEPSKWAVDTAKKKGLNVTKGTIDDIKRVRFDVITLIDVIEHVDSPSELLKSINNKLYKSGLLCVVTPDYGSIASKIFNQKWWHIRPDHIYYFDRKTLYMALWKCGFEIVEARRYKWTFSLKYWLSRLQGRISLIESITNSQNRFVQYLLSMSLSINFFDSMEIYAKKIKDV